MEKDFHRLLSFSFQLKFRELRRSSGAGFAKGNLREIVIGRRNNGFW